MSGTFKVGRIFGFDVYVHWSWFFILFLVTASFATSVLNEFYPELTTTQAWIVAGFISLLFFCSILLHEMSHSLVARHYGLQVPSITLFVFGGVSSLVKEPDNPRQEFWVAIVGPLTSFAIALVLGVAYLPLHELDHGAAAIASNLAFINLVLGVFNLVPGFPLDGGRVLRSVIWMKKRDLLGATRLAAAAGQAVAYLVMAIGVFLFLFHDVLSGIWFFLIGSFLKNASEASYAQLFSDTVLKGVRASEIATQDYTAVSPELTLADLAEQHVLAGHGRCFLVMAGEELLGIVTLTDLRKTPRESWRTTTVYRAMTPFPELKVVASDDDLSKVIALIAGDDLNQVPVVDRKLVRGLIERTDLLKYIQVRQELGQAAERPPEASKTAANV